MLNQDIAYRIGACIQLTKKQRDEWIHQLRSSKPKKLPWQRVVITGYGLLMPHAIYEEHGRKGQHEDQFWGNIKAGLPVFSRVEFPDNVQWAGIIPDFSIQDYFPNVGRKEERKASIAAQMSAAAAKRALANARLLGEDQRIFPEYVETTGIIMGASLAYLPDQMFVGETLAKHRLYTALKLLPEAVQHVLGTKKDITPSDALKIFLETASGYPARWLGIMGGPYYTSIGACSASANAILDGYYSLINGRSNVMLVGGVDHFDDKGASLKVFTSTRAISTLTENPSTPFKVGRDGFVPSRAAAVLVLERLDQAIARGAKIYAEVLGGMSRCDADIAKSDTDGNPLLLAQTMFEARNLLEISKDEALIISPHATSTPLGDANELEALLLFQAKHPGPMIVVPTKALTGHPLAASGAIEAILSMHMLQSGLIPAIPHLEPDGLEPDAKGLTFATDKVQHHQIKIALSNSLGFFGHTVVLGFKRWEG